MVDMIEVIISHGINDMVSYIVYPEENTCYINENKYYISKENIEHILNIIATWKYEYGTSSNIDMEEFLVKVNSNNEETIYHGKGIYPSNYDEFKSALGEVFNG